MDAKEPALALDANGEFHFTALRTLGTFRTMSASRRFPSSLFQPGIAVMYACRSVAVGLRDLQIAA